MSTLLSRIAGTALVPFLIASARPGAVIRTITLTGNHAIPTGTILGVMTSKPPAAYVGRQVSSDVNSVLSLYHDAGYYFATAGVRAEMSGDSSTVDLTIAIVESLNVTVREILLTGNDHITGDLLIADWDTRAGVVLDPHRLEQDVEGIIRRYERAGYPFASVEIKDISVVFEEVSPFLRIRINVNEGSPVDIRTIRVTGNSETRDEVILRETGLHLPERYDEDKIRRAMNRLNRLNIFARVREPELQTGPEGGSLLLAVEEGNTNTFDGVVGYLPGNGASESGVLTGFASVAMRNLFGTGRSLHVRWLRDDRSSQEISLQYTEPWMFGLPIDLGGSFLQRQQDSSFVRRSLEVKTNLRVADDGTLSGILARDEVIPSSALSHQIVGQSHTNTAGLEISYDTRNDRINPTTGVRYNSGYRIGTKYGGYGASSSSTIQRLSLDAECYGELIRRQVVVLGVHGRQHTSDTPDAGDLYRFGGTTSLRGYRENQFIGSRVAWTNLEYRFLLSRRSFFSGFFDTGYIYVPDGIPGVPSTGQVFRYGYGIGVRLETSLGMMGVSLALGEGDGFSDAKIHIGLINDF